MSERSTMILLEELGSWRRVAETMEAENRLLNTENAALRDALREAFSEGFYDGSFGSNSRKREEEDWNDSRTKRLLSEFIINKEDGE